MSWYLALELSELLYEKECLKGSLRLKVPVVADVTVAVADANADADADVTDSGGLIVAADVGAIIIF